MKHQDDINTYVSYFEEQINKVTDLEDKLYKKILYLCMLDTLGKARYPKHDNQKRIISFLLNYAGSADMTRVSMPQLLFNLDHILKDSAKSTSRLYVYVKQKTDGLISGHFYRGHEVDPFYNEVASYANVKEKKKLKLARYAELFYTFRNQLVHGFNETAHCFEMSSDSTNPYYHSERNGPWQLYFPADYFKSLCTEGLNNLKTYLEDNGINPYERYDFSDMWTDPKKLLAKKNRNIFCKLIDFIKEKIRT